MPIITRLRVRLRPMRSEIKPPAGRANRFIMAKLEPTRPACTKVRPCKSLKYSGNMETTAISEPNETA